MPPSSRSYALTDLSWVQVAEQLTRDSRLIIPVGACDQYGPHLPIGATMIVSDRLACDLAAEFGVLRAPSFSYGVTLPAERIFAGSAGVRAKTLNRALNDLLSSWEEQGFTEFILITAQAYDGHLESLTTVAAREARVRVINALAVDPPRNAPGPRGPEHGGELLTSLLLHLYPDVVRMDTAEDIPPPPPRFKGLGRNRLTEVPAVSSGVIGWPTHASAEAGERIYAHILQKIREKVFLSPDDTTI